MKFQKLGLDGLYLLKPAIYEDSRGYFFESYREKYLNKQGLNATFVQDNISSSVKGVIRGLHYQVEPAAQAKLIMVTKGKIVDIAVDIRTSSPTYKKFEAVELDDQNHHQLFIPKGFAHGFAVLSEQAIISYKCSSYYNPSFERGIRWDDPDLNINWKIKNPVLSNKDKNLPYLKSLNSEDLF